MIHKEILDKNEICYALLSSYNEPNILIPIKGIIQDIKFDYDEPNYLIQIEKFYDTMTFLKTHVYNMFFYTKFSQMHKVTFSFNGINNKNDLNRYLDNNNITVVAHSLMTFKKKFEMSEIFDKINFYFILLNFFNLKENLTRSFYNGFLKFDGKKEFFEKLKSFIGDKFPTKDGIQLKDVISDISKTKPINALKYEKIKRTDYIKKK